MASRSASDQGAGSVREGGSTKTRPWSSSLVDDFDTFLFDCDGVLWRGGERIPGAIEAIQRLLKLGKNVYFVTNNSSKSRKQYVTKIAKYGLSVNASQILSSSYAAASYLQAKGLLKGKKALVIGMEGINLELKEHGIDYVNASDILRGGTWTPARLLELKIDPSIGAVVVGMDLEFTYAKGALATLTMQANKGCFLLSTNQDFTFPAEGGKFLPGSGANVAYVETACMCKATNVGKPEPWMLEGVKRQMDGKLDLARTLMVGDRLNTDIRFGNSGGVATLVTLTGVTQEADLAAEGPVAQKRPAIETPDYVIDSVANLFKAS